MHILSNGKVCQCQLFFFENCPVCPWFRYSLSNTYPAPVKVSNGLQLSCPTLHYQNCPPALAEWPLGLAGWLLGIVGWLQGRAGHPQAWVVGSQVWLVGPQTCLEKVFKGLQSKTNCNFIAQKLNTEVSTQFLCLKSTLITCEVMSCNHQCPHHSHFSSSR